MLKNFSISVSRPEAAGQRSASLSLLGCNTNLSDGCAEVRNALGNHKSLF